MSTARCSPSVPISAGQPPAPGLAADILDDGLAADKPNHHRRLIEVVLRVLDDLKTLAHQLSAEPTLPDATAWPPLASPMTGCSSETGCAKSSVIPTRATSATR